MPRDFESSLNEKQFIIKALRENLRLDNRAFDQYRPFELTFGDDYGSVDVKLGKTRIFAKASAEVSAPFSDRPLDGIFTIAVELSPMTSPCFESGRPTKTEILLARLLEKTVRRSGALDTESLCLVAGQKCWSVRVDVHALCDDGNLTDASCLAVVAAIRHFRKPDTSMEDGELTVYTPAEREPVPLGWLHTPLCVSFSFFGDSAEILVLDATWNEEQVRVGSCTVSLNKHGEVCQVTKLGGTAVEALDLLKCIQMALVKSRVISEYLDQQLADDAKRRDKGGLLAELRAENDR